MVDSTTTNLDFGTNGYYLPMDGSGTTVGSDQSGKGNDWSLTNLSSSNVCSQSPSGIVYSGKQRRGGSMTTAVFSAGKLMSAKIASALEAKKLTLSILFWRAFARAQSAAVSDTSTPATFLKLEANVRAKRPDPQ